MNQVLPVEAPGIWSSMMAQKHFDLGLVGDNPFSYLFAISALKQGKRVLLIDDYRVQLGELYAGSLGLLEINYLKSWGAELNSSVLAKIDDYVVQAPHQLLIGNQRMRLGNQSCYQNLCELVRKFPSLLAHLHQGSSDPHIFSARTQTQFHQDMEDLYRRLAETIFRYKGTENLSATTITLHAPHYIQQWIQAFEQWAQTVSLSTPDTKREQYLLEIGLLSLVRSYFQLQISPKASKLEWYGLCLRLLSPLYQLDTERLGQDLRQEFLALGGVLKRAQIRDWFFKDMRPWAVELDSYDGPVYPKKILFLGQMEEHLLYSYGSSGITYCTLVGEVDWEYLKHYQGELFVMTDPERMGSAFPLSMLTFDRHEQRAYMHMLIQTQAGARPYFYAGRWRQEVEKWITLLAPDGMQNYKHLETSLHFGFERWLIPETAGNKKTARQRARKSDQNDQTSINQYERLQLNQCDGPLVKRPIKDVYYVGPLNGHCLGVYSLLLELRDLMGELSSAR